MDINEGENRFLSEFNENKLGHHPPKAIAYITANRTENSTYFELTHAAISLY